MPAAGRGSARGGGGVAVFAIDCPFARCRGGLKSHRQTPVDGAPKPIQTNREIMKKHELPALPYAHDALEPHIDKATMEIHHGKHHQAYITNVNKALEGHGALGDQSVEALISNLGQG